jgi:7,8-dihydropterin-6-yl-methyl-4-(beta-D-ribofuranosyl)aminobenzene 5'-phosphate synthase
MSTAEGLVVVVGCSHAGLLNTLHYVVRLSGQRDIHAVIGGFHLSSASNERIDRTVEELWEIRVGLVVPCHCTGEQATERLARRFGARCVPGRAGQKYRFGGQTGRLSL